MLHALLVIAAEKAEPSKTPFYIAGGALAIWAVLLGWLGLSRPNFPGSATGERGVIAISAVLTLAAMAAIIATA